MSSPAQSSLSLELCRPTVPGIVCLLGECTQQRCSLRLGPLFLLRCATLGRRAGSGPKSGRQPCEANWAPTRMHALAREEITSGVTCRHCIACNLKKDRKTSQWESCTSCAEKACRLVCESQQNRKNYAALLSEARQPIHRVCRRGRVFDSTVLWEIVCRPNGTVP